MFIFITIILYVCSYDLFSSLSCGYGKIDLTYLASPIDYTTNGFTPSKYFMNICGPVNFYPCKQHNLLSNVCQTRNNTVINLASWDKDHPPVWSYINQTDQTRGVKALYNNGDTCNLTNRSYTLEINYECQKTTSPHFIMLQEDECTFKIEHQVNCNAQPLYPSRTSGYALFVIIFMAVMLPFFVAMFIQQCRRCRRLKHVNWYATRKELCYRIRTTFCCDRERIHYVSEQNKHNYQRI